ncbi:DUF2726 domain-containing protein [Helicobacter aurati]|uniref:DUF2726 domain-containing protein n=1 Tax=Helicobacter aurati TaxID=137778 RepID=A0A3D8J7J2_9HELI|nr:AAA domain-containing protein [Helicobacter aurati]RDU72854.1 DUF2726 domain-containing protein [Helicobacter aurati]
MDTQKYLILLKNQDRTQDIESYTLENECLKVKFFHNHRIYTHKAGTFVVFDNPQIINPQTQFQQSLFYNVNTIILFKEYYKIFFNDKSSKLIPACELEISKPKKADVFTYCKEIVSSIGLKDQQGLSLLQKFFDKITHIQSNLALYAYLHGICKKFTDKEPLLFPFGSNLSQTQAVQNALTNQISIIEGPPGTGKTQTILNIIANLLYRDKSIAVVSNNNAAIQNVYEKLKDYDLEYLCAFLGNKENKESFIQNQSGEYADLSYEAINIHSHIEQIQLYNTKLKEIFILQNNLAKNQSFLKDFSLEFEYFIKEKSYLLPKIRNPKTLTSQKILQIKIALENNKNISFFSKLKLIFLEGIGNFSFYKQATNDILSTYENLYYLYKLDELKKSIESNKKELQDLDKDLILKNLTNTSLQLLKNHLKTKFDSQKQRKVFSLKDLYDKPQEFLGEYPIIFSTTHSIKSSLHFDCVFDYVIIDEASQVDLSTAILALSAAKNIVIVGDSKQLGNVISKADIEKIAILSKKFSIPKHYDYALQSFLSSASKSLNNVPKVLLKEHYRCHPKIIGFCNKKFYNNELVIFSKDSYENDVIEVLITPKGNFARGQSNKREVQVVMQELLPSLEAKIEHENIGIITPFNEQKALLQNHLSKISQKIQIDTVHKYQGREKEAIIITTTANESNAFIDDPQMLNVAITRAKRYLRMVVSHKIYEQKGHIRDFIDYVQYHNFELKESKIHSVFDLLYQENTSLRHQFFKNKQKVSKYDSENLIYHLLKEILEENNFALDFVIHYPLYKLLKSYHLLDENEKQYAQNPLTHLDFLLYSTMNKQPILAIEVDGYAFHKQETKQYQRDLYKNNILKKYDLKLMRLSTTDSNEKARIIQTLQEVAKG